MEKTIKNNLDREAMILARAYSGQISWASLAFSLTLIAAYGLLLFYSVIGAVNTELAIFLLVVLSYALYTPIHQAVHGNLSGNPQKATWLDELIGSLASVLSMTQFTMHKAAHLMHHSNTNDSKRDPDNVFGDDKPHQVLWGTFFITINQNIWYFNTRWAGATLADKLRVVSQASATIGLRVTIAVAGYPVEALLFSVLPGVLGAMFTTFVFAWAVHQPHENQKRYQNTSTFVFNRWVDTPITYLWLFQNYHSIHHLFPRVPFHQYRNLFAEIEPIMIDKQAPIYYLGFSRNAGR